MNQVKQDEAHDVTREDEGHELETVIPLVVGRWLWETFLRVASVDEFISIADDVSSVAGVIVSGEHCSIHEMPIGLAIV